MTIAKGAIEEQLKQLRYFDVYFTRKEIKYLPEVIREGEVLRALISGVYDGTTWLIVATNQRVVFLDKGFFYGLKQLDLPLDKIQGIAHKTGLFFGTLSITTGGAEWKVEQLRKEGTAKFAEIVSEQIQSAKVQPSVPVAPEDIVSKLERLGKLKESGVLNEQEFQIQKGRILAGL